MDTCNTPACQDHTPLSLRVQEVASKHEALEKDVSEHKADSKGRFLRIEKKLDSLTWKLALIVGGITALPYLLKLIPAAHAAIGGQ